MTDVALAAPLASAMTRFLRARRHDWHGIDRHAQVFGFDPLLASESFADAAGEVYPRCPQHPVANLAGTAPTGAVVAGPAAVADFVGMTAPDGARPCHAGAFDRFTGRGARYVDDVAAWPSVEPTLDATATGVLALSLLAG